MARTDTELLDFLQKLTDESTYSGAVILRNSTTGRGWRLHGCERKFGNSNVREAISSYMDAVEKDA